MSGRAREASEMLEAALEQMDGILAGTRQDIYKDKPFTNGYHNGHTPKNGTKKAQKNGKMSSPISTSTPNSPQLPILSDMRVQIGRLTNMLDDMKVITDAMNDRKEVMQRLPEDQIEFLHRLVQDTGFRHDLCCAQGYDSSEHQHGPDEFSTNQDWRPDADTPGPPDTPGPRGDQPYTPGPRVLQPCPPVSPGPLGAPGPRVVKPYTPGPRVVKPHTPGPPSRVAPSDPPSPRRALPRRPGPRVAPPIPNTGLRAATKVFDIDALLRDGAVDSLSWLRDASEGDVMPEKLRKAMCRALVSGIVSQFGWRPGTNEKISLARDLVTAYPVLRDTSSTGYGCWYTPSRNTATKHQGLGFLEWCLANRRKRRAQKSANPGTAGTAGTAATAATAPANAPRPTAPVLNDELSEAEAARRTKWLQRHEGPELQVRRYMASTVASRRAWILENGGELMDSIIFHYPRLMVPGMIAQDFAVMYPDHETALLERFMDVWHDVFGTATQTASWTRVVGLREDEVATLDDEAKYHLAMSLIPLTAPGEKPMGHSLTEYVDEFVMCVPTNGFSSENVCEAREGPHDTLLLRVSVLTEQVQSQTEKIQDLEISLEDQQGKLAVTEEMLQNEVLGKTTLETQKIDLMGEISELKIKLASAEAETKEYEEKLWLAQRQIDELKSRLTEKDCELTELKIRLAKNDAFLSTSPSLNSNCSTETEVDRLKRTIETLVAANNDKDTKINDLHRALRRYKSLEPPRREPRSSLGGDDEHSDGSSGHSEHHKPDPFTNNGGVAIFAFVHTKKKNNKVNGGMNGNRFEHLMSMPTATSTPDAHRYQHGTLPSPPSTIHSSPTPPKSPSAHLLAEEMMTSQRSPPMKPPRQPMNGGENGQHYRSSLRSDPRQGYPSMGPPAGRPRARTPDPMGPHATMIVPGDSSTLPPRRKRQSERMEEEATMLRLKDERAQQYKSIQQTGEKKKKGIKKIFSKSSGKLKRSNSQEDVQYDDAEDDERLGEFKRGGIRSTAGARLGWSKDMIHASDLVVPFPRWDSERCALWLHELGLNMYVSECRRNIKNGEQLQKASSRDLEHDLGMKNHLHKKKLFLALKTSAFDPARDRMHRLDHNWVTKWLDDIGLPQYKDAFLDGRVDGRMLHFLTVEDLLHLKVSSSLHHYSIKRAIQILRTNGFNPDCLRRRPSEDQVELEDAAEEVQLWTNHRVMEWLRSIDLSEYAPNLRGSGVHGALMVLEPAFNAELFAAILSISPSKTLLRRHLKTHFTSLVGAQVQQYKREYEATSGNQPLTPNMKIKFRKHGLFQKRNKSDPDFDNYVCPMDVHGGKHWTKNGNTTKYAPEPELTRLGASPQESNSNGRDNMNNEVNVLTGMLERERFLSDDTIPATNV